MRGLIWASFALVVLVIAYFVIPRVIQLTLGKPEDNTPDNPPENIRELPLSEVSEERLDESEQPHGRRP